jgi:glutamine synthetase
MAEIKGMLTLEQLGHLARENVIHTVQVVFTDLYGRFLGKRIDVDFFLDQVAEHGTHACNYLLTVDMEMEPVPGYDFANWEKGYGDFHLVPDLATLRVTSWLEGTAMVICDVHHMDRHAPVMEAPRSLLRARIADAAQMGFTPMVGSELEYYIFEDNYREAADKGYAALRPAGWYLEDYHMLQGSREESFNAAVRRHLKASGVPVECSKGEWGLGQHEINVQYSDALQMADRHGVFKQCLREVADQQGRSITFMAKFATDRAGSSCHLHVSLRKDGRNAFAGQETLGPVKCSPEFKWFLGGWLAHAPECMVFYAPTINAYKRYQAGSWAPTRIAWSHDNRTAGFRVVGRGESLRIECRIPGADCNPYLAFAAAIASGLDGIRNRIEPPAVFEGDMYAARDLPQVPRCLRDAIACFEQSAWQKSLLGEDVVRHYAHFYRVEQAAFDAAVTDWERKRYFERI